MICFASVRSCTYRVDRYIHLYILSELQCISCEISFERFCKLWIEFYLVVGSMF